MQISIFGRTDKRACIYTLLKILQPMGDVAVVTNNRHFMRLTEDGTPFGYYQNISIFVTDATADEMWHAIEHRPDDFDHVILDNLYNEDTDLILYVQGAGVEALDEYLFDTFEDMQVINMGRGKNAVPYTKELMENLEKIEYFRKLSAPSPGMLSVLAKILSGPLNMPAKNIVKVASRAFGFLLSVPLLFVAIFLLLVIHNVKQEEMQFEEYVLKFAIDYSTDAAVEEMLNMSHLGQDYTDQGRTNSDPQVALDTFLNLMCMNYDLPLTEKAKLQIESGYIPVFCVAAYNGYYMYTPTKDSEGGWYLQGTQKIPYAYVVGDKYYALNLGGDNVHLLKDGQLTKATLASQGLEVKEVYRQINSIVSDALMYQFQLSTGRGGEFVYIPSALTTFKRVNPIEGPTVLAFIDGWDFKTTHAISAFSIGGAQIEASRMVAGYEAINPDGSITKMYAYADLLPENKHVIDMFTSVEEAAKAGYYYDPVFMG